MNQHWIICAHCSTEIRVCPQGELCEQTGDHHVHRIIPGSVHNKGGGRFSVAVCPVFCTVCEWEKKQSGREKEELYGDLQRREAEAKRALRTARPEDLQ